MLNYNTTRLEKKCRKLVETFDNQLSWKWDGRFETVLAEFGTQEKESVCKIIKTQMGFKWDNDNVSKAPELVKMIIDFFGGLHEGQQLFTSKIDNGEFLLCAFWPWGDGKTVSIRLGVFADSLGDDENKELTLLFKDWFKL
jgi:hypothetical protein